MDFRSFSPPSSPSSPASLQKPSPQGLLSKSATPRCMQKGPTEFETWDKKSSDYNLIWETSVADTKEMKSKGRHRTCVIDKMFPT